MPATASAVVELGLVVICVRSRAGAAVDVITSSSDTSISWPPRVGLDESSMSAQMTQPYANVPAHKRYSWYKHYGFGGKGAKTSWGYNPKRGDIGARYESAKSQPAKCTACPASEK